MACSRCGEENPVLVFGIFFIIISLFIGFCVGFNVGTGMAKEEAIKVGVAKYVQEDTTKPETKFTWITNSVDKLK